MFLKTLVLKGFKSFAEKSTLSLEPGITAIVGPNGSGKSNISDAVLWVLGERNAKHLRGQSMEDVIFNGSSARKAAGVVEVELVLDNTCNTLPVEFSEVSIARRLYRTGESEYLIGGNVARRMDVLDILSECGLGSTSHSIISQGNLNEILQSKPEERRALIEEAAGVLKHRQRKVKSQRKLEQMDVSLSRVRDVVAEVKRQLGPLERRAKQAKKHAELTRELHEISLALAVDDLRKLQSTWDKTCESEQALASEIAGAHQAISKAEAKAQQADEEIRKHTQSTGQLSKKYQRATNIIERFDGAVLLLHEKARNAKSSEADIRINIEQDASKQKSAKEQLKTLKETLDAANNEKVEADKKVCDLSERRTQNENSRRSLESELRELEKKSSSNSGELKRLRQELLDTKEALTTNKAKASLVKSRSAELESKLETANAKAQSASDAAKVTLSAYDAAKEAEHAAQAEVSVAIDGRRKAQEALDVAKEAHTVCAGKISALEAVERSESAGGAARAWLLEHAKASGNALSQLSHVMRVDAGFEPLVEALLGHDVSAVVADSTSNSKEFANAVIESSKPGRVAIMAAPAGGAGSSIQNALANVRQIASKLQGVCLFDKIDCKPSVYASVFEILGNVIVFDTFSVALNAQASAVSQKFTNVCFAALSGEIISASGKITVGTAASGEGGVLSHARQLEHLSGELETASKKLNEATAELKQAEATLRAAQEKSLKCCENTANLRGGVKSAEAESEKAARELQNLQSEFQSVTQQHAQALEVLEQQQPNVEVLQERINKLEQEEVSSTNRIAEIKKLVVPLRQEAARIRDALSDAKLASAKLLERINYARRMVESKQREIDSASSTSNTLQRQLVTKICAQKRANALLATIDVLINSARKRTQALEQQTQAAESSSASLHEQVDAARKQAADAHAAYDTINSKLSSVRVEKGKLEIQVKSVVNKITQDMHASLESALELPELEGRAQAEQTEYSLKQRISKMGNINPDAASEYDELKSRYDYLCSQLDDMHSARQALGRIVRIINSRMKTDFERTFAQVNENFSSIFSTLFPGGSANLTLTCPEDIENTGVEVNAQPRGKHITKMSLMSGGEKSLCALALLFAIYKIRSAPFYILDEVEAALDDLNMRRLLAYLESIRNETQLIMITHQRRTMEAADVLFGVSMQVGGITKVISQKLDHALKYAE